MPRLLVIGFVLVVLSLTASACGSSGGSPGADAGTGPLHVVARNSVDRLRKPGADNSLEEFGHEASRPELVRAATAVHAYLVAWVDEDWTAACSVASSELHRILEPSSGPSRTTGGRGCVKAIGEVASGEPPLGRTPYEATDMKAVALREEGGVGYLFFYLGRTGYQQEVVREHGRWGVKAPLPSTPH